ncbi:PIN domain-containing protein [Paenibacillus allorhizosphaerae]|uniref:PDZ domain-containing protein n=1 Tax=Paenibacillus allorhizosphaerae TaxID=2849866 RepID=A0ABN7TV10_9BACL|nr:PIN domain-containing protein [Paenibacillus allorhizosphaerae]CAG7651395.1 hypothetical protein PAECIP111802_04952 [Paenibacillus allorhizosphaerae]
MDSIWIIILFVLALPLLLLTFFIIMSIISAIVPAPAPKQTSDKLSDDYWYASYESHENGVLIKYSNPNGPLYYSGIITGDIITEVNGEKPTAALLRDQLQAVVEQDQPVPITLYHIATPSEVRTLLLKPMELALEKVNAKGIVEKFGASFNGHQVIFVRYVEQSSPFAAAGIKAGDRMVSIAGRKLECLEDPYIISKYLHTGMRVEISFVNQFNVTKQITLDISNPEDRVIQSFGISLSPEQTVAFDTNFVINHPNVIPYMAKKSTVLISKKVFLELDKLKIDPEIGHQARAGLEAIETAQVESEGRLKVVPIDEHYNRQHGLDTKNPDDLIIGSYLKVKESMQEEVLFLSEDRGARITARSHGLFVANQ